MAKKIKKSKAKLNAKPIVKKRKLIPGKKRTPRPPRAKKPEPREVGLIDAIIEGYCEVEDLAQGMRDWADSLEEKFSTTQKYETVSSSADTLEGITDGTTEENAKMLNGFKITVQDRTPTRSGQSRATRSSDVVNLWQQCLEKLEEIRDSEGDHAADQAEKDHAENVHSDLEEHIQELEGVEYPGMFG